MVFTSLGRPAYAVSRVAYFADTAGKKPSEENNHRRHKTDFRSQHCPIGNRVLRREKPT